VASNPWSQYVCLATVSGGSMSTSHGPWADCQQYPTEYVKTRKQLHSSSESIGSILINTLRKAGLGGLYAGAGAFVASNASKSGVRFVTFDVVKTWLPQDEQTRRPTKVASMVAGVAAGVAESVTVVTPGENIKTRIIQDRAGGKRLRTTAQVVREILANDGIRGDYRGVLPVTMKQGSNALVRFTSYTALLANVEYYLANSSLSGLSTAVAGALAGVATVYATMPFDVVKTKMQALVGGAGGCGPPHRRSTLGCFADVVREGGLASLWKGTTPRLARLSVGFFPLP
jgi:solute carrier family 25 (mitochondrial citrate transporter), member 1